MAEKVTVMVLKVDLQCSCCYKKIKNILCNCPKIRGQIFDVKQNTVTINVVCCSPEKVRDKLICKAGKIIKSIEIVEDKSEKQKPDKSKKQNDSDPCSRTKSPPTRTCCGPCSEGYGGGPCHHGGPPVRRKLPDDQPRPPQARTCCGPCSEGYGGGPCYQGYPAPPPCYNGYYGYGSGCRCGCGRGYQLKCVCYIEENPSPECNIM